MPPGNKKKRMTLTALERGAIIGLDEFLAQYPNCNLELVDVIKQKLAFRVAIDSLVNSMVPDDIEVDVGISYRLDASEPGVMIVEVFYTGACSNHIEVIRTLERVSHNYLSKLLKPKHS